ncbi:MAG: hypothetical protein IJ673_06300 [Treponema sp.]|nr:hypothetical protein [Treponema sp.]
MNAPPYHFPRPGTRAESPTATPQLFGEYEAQIFFKEENALSLSETESTSLKVSLKSPSKSVFEKLKRLFVLKEKEKKSDSIEESKDENPETSRFSNKNFP